MTHSSLTLTLTHGYPAPWCDAYAGPKGSDGAPMTDNPYAIEAGNPGQHVVLKGVIHFQQLHTTTVEFDTHKNMMAAQSLTGWPRWGSEGWILEAPTDSLEGYGHPAILADIPYELEEGYKGDEAYSPKTAYCGYILSVK